MRYVHCAHVYDFYKPDLSSEYPLVDGKLSINCYLEALDKCYQGYKSKVEQKKNSEGTFEGDNDTVNLEYFDYMVFHVPFSRLCQKSLARLMLNDFLQENPNNAESTKYEVLHAFRYSLKILMTRITQIASFPLHS